MIFRLIIVLLTVCLGTAAAAAAASNPKLSFGGQMVRVCSFVDTATREPDFADAACRTQRLWELDPQGRHLWVELRFDARDALLLQLEPLGLFIHAKASSAAWLNGRPLGVNGVPGDSAAKEVPGQMDAVLFVPPGALQAGANRLVLRMSSMNGLMRLSHPVHDVLLAPYRSAGERVLTFLPALLTTGLFLAGVAYFGVSAWYGYDREGSAILAVTSLAAALQLMIESARGFLSYPYPWHEVRLLLILCLAMVVALGLTANLLLGLFRERRRARWLATGVMVPALAAVAWAMPGFDGKTLMVLVLAAAVGTVAGLLAWRGGTAAGAPTAVAALALATAMLVIGPAFLNLHLYLALGVLLLWLFVRQAQQVARERIERMREVGRADELAKALVRAETAHRPPMLELSQGSRTEYVAAPAIRHFAAAGDYVEARWGDGRSGLYSGTLAALENLLPPGFIRTHRSHIVNSADVSQLERDASGTGRLVLSDGSEVPVSRRILPDVRRSLK